MYADDIVLLAENEADLQCMIDKLYECCKKWRMKVNESKTNIVHFRNKVTHCTNVSFKLGDNVLNKVEKYIYLWVIQNEYLENDTTATIISEAAGRALGAVIGKKNTCQIWDLKHLKSYSALELCLF